MSGSRKPRGFSGPGAMGPVETGVGDGSGVTVGAGVGAGLGALETDSGGGGAGAGASSSLGVRSEQDSKMNGEVRRIKSFTEAKGVWRECLSSQSEAMPKISEGKCWLFLCPPRWTEADGQQEKLFQGGEARGSFFFASFSFKKNRLVCSKGLFWRF